MKIGGTIEPITRTLASFLFLSQKIYLIVLWRNHRSAYLCDARCVEGWIEWRRILLAPQVTQALSYIELVKRV